MICRPTGKLSSGDRPDGTDIPQWPARFSGSVHRSNRYIANGSSTFSDGAAVAAVSAGGAAEKAGLAAGDVITKVGDRAVDSADALIAAIRTQRPGDKVVLTYTHNGKEATAQVTLGSDASGS